MSDSATCCRKQRGKLIVVARDGGGHRASVIRAHSERNERGLEGSPLRKFAEREKCGMGDSGEHPTTFLTPRAASTLCGQMKARATSLMSAMVTKKNQPPARYLVSVEFEGQTYCAEYFYDQVRVVVTHPLLGKSSTRTAGEEMDRAIIAPGLLRGLLLYGKATKGLLDLCVANKKPAGCG